jgi:hypothetical protein
MAWITAHLPAVLTVLALLGAVAMSVVFIIFAMRATTWQARLTCLVMSVIALLPIGFIVLLAIAVSED